MHKLSVIVIDKPMGLGDTIHTCVSIHVICITIYHQNKRFETMIKIKFMAIQGSCSTSAKLVFLKSLRVASL